jgi:FtsH-binding integral membrane protein
VIRNPKHGLPGAVDRGEEPVMPLFVRIFLIVAAALLAFAVLAFLIKILFVAAVIAALVVGGMVVVGAFRRRRLGQAYPLRRL